MKDLVKAEIKDEQLIREYLNGDNDSFGILYCRYYSKVYSRCFSFSRNHDDAFDMTQEILLKAVSNVASFNGAAKFSTWLYSITNNYCISQTIRKGKNYIEDMKAAQNIVDENTDEEHFQERIRWEAVESRLDVYLMQLPKEERELLVLKYHKNYSIKDLQNEFALSASAVKMRLLRARLKMVQLINLREAA